MSQAAVVPSARLNISSQRGQSRGSATFKAVPSAAPGMLCLPQVRPAADVLQEAHGVGEGEADPEEQRGGDPTGRRRQNFIFPPGVAQAEGIDIDAVIGGNQRPMMASQNQAIRTVAG